MDPAVAALVAEAGALKLKKSKAKKGVVEEDADAEGTPKAVAA